MTIHRRSTPLEFRCVTGVTPDAWRAEFREADLSRAAKTVGHLLASYADWKTGRNIFPSWERVARETKYSVRTVGYAYEELTDRRWIVKDSQGGHGRSSRYSLGLPRHVPVSNTEPMQPVAEDLNTELEPMQSAEEPMQSADGTYALGCTLPPHLLDRLTTTAPRENPTPKLEPRKLALPRPKTFASNSTERNYLRATWLAAAWRRYESWDDPPVSFEESVRKACQSDWQYEQVEDLLGTVITAFGEAG